MTNLEFIEKDIKNIQEILNDKDSPFRKDNSFWNNRLNHLQQIKTILEAWYEIKDLYKKGYFSRIALPMESHEKIKKALELKDV